MDSLIDGGIIYSLSYVRSDYCGTVCVCLCIMGFFGEFRGMGAGEGEESEMFSVNDGSGAGMCNVSTVFFNF